MNIVGVERNGVLDVTRTDFFFVGNRNKIFVFTRFFLYSTNFRNNKGTSFSRSFPALLSDMPMIFDKSQQCLISKEFSNVIHDFLERRMLLILIDTATHIIYIIDTVTVPVRVLFIAHKPFPTLLLIME